jgi:hypothetical protein
MDKGRSQKNGPKNLHLGNGGQITYAVSTKQSSALLGNVGKFADDKDWHSWLILGHQLSRPTCARQTKHDAMPLIKAENSLESTRPYRS